MVEMSATIELALLTELGGERLIDIGLGRTLVIGAVGVRQ
jgi:hypothetical protein